MEQLPRKSYKWLLLPCLNKVREFDGKLLLAAAATERGWGTIVGYKGFIEHDVFDVGGVVLERSFKSRDLERHATARRRISAFDEEGLVFTTPEDYSRRRLRLLSMRQLDVALLWGQNQKRTILSHLPEVEGRLCITGSPRFDMLRPELIDFYRGDVAALTARYGRFILINTNFGFVNHYFGGEFSLRDLKSQGTVATAAQEQDQLAREAHEAVIMKAFVEALPVIRSQFPDRTVIIRPHPSEDFEAWRVHARGLQDVFVVHDGDIIPWLLAAGVTMHNGCTTGIQSYLLGRPAVTYMPVRSPQYDKPLPNSLSVRAEDLGDLLSKLAALLSDPSAVSQAQQLEWKAIAEDHIEGLAGPWAVDRMLDALEGLAVEQQTLTYRSPSTTRHRDGWRSGIRDQARALRNKIRQIGNPRTPYSA